MSTEDTLARNADRPVSGKEKAAREAAAVKAAVRLMGQEGPPGESVWEALVRIAGEREAARKAFLAVEEERDAALGITRDPDPRYAER